jgi:ribosome-binding factor A
MPRHRNSSQTKGSHAKGPSQRQLRVGEVLRHALSDIMRQTDIRDPDLSGVSVTVTEVKPSPDMRHATAFVEPLGGRNAGAIIAALNRHRGFLRGELGRTITLKFTPELRFVEDTSFAEAERIARILHSERVARDLQAEGAPSEDDDGA